MEPKFTKTIMLYKLIEQKNTVGTYLMNLYLGSVTVLSIFNNNK